MSDEPTNADNAVGQDEDPRPPGHDVFLRVFAYLANVEGIGVGVTLYVGGLLISGTTIGRRRYTEGITRDMRSAFGQAPEELKSFMEEELFVPLTELEQKRMPPTDIRDIEYIHLENARVYNNGVPIPSEESGGFLWRGRLASIDGFSFGALTTKKVE